MATPRPTAAPFTAATIGLEKAAIAFVNSLQNHIGIKIKLLLNEQRIGLIIFNLGPSTFTNSKIKLVANETYFIAEANSWAAFFLLSWLSRLSECRSTPWQKAGPLEESSSTLHDSSFFSCTKMFFNSRKT